MTLSPPLILLSDRNEGGSTTQNTMHVGWSLQLQRLAAARLQLQRLPSPAPLPLASNCRGTLLLASNSSGSPPIPCCCSPPTAATCYCTFLPAHFSEKVEPSPRSSTDSTTAFSYPQDLHVVYPPFSARFNLFLSWYWYISSNNLKFLFYFQWSFGAL
jgi:hypothetical protein